MPVIVTVLVCTLPHILAAQGYSSTPCFNGMDVRCLASKVVEILDMATRLLVLVAVMLYLSSVGFSFWRGEEGREALKTYTLWGILAIFVLVSIWGILALLRESLTLPQI